MFGPMWDGIDGTDAYAEEGGFGVTDAWVWVGWTD